MSMILVYQVYSTMVEVYTEAHVVHIVLNLVHIRAIRSIRRIVNRERTLGLLSTEFILLATAVFMLWVRCILRVLF